MRTMQSEDYMVTVIINKRPKSATLQLHTNQYSHPQTIYGNASIKNKRIAIQADQCAVILWQKQ
jgi:hypothetical protein